MALEGIDVYSGNGGVEWHRVVGAGKVFAFVRGAYGDVPDKAAVQNFTSARHAGLLTGVYAFYRVTRDPQVQLQTMLDVLTACGFGSGDLPPVIDVEDNPRYDGEWSTNNNAKFVAGLRAWIAGIKARYGCDPIIYTRTSFWQLIGDPDGFDSSPLWVARYGPQAGATPSQWPIHTFWQYTDTGAVPGVPGDCDLDRFNGDIGRLHALALP
jgi:GH25 family lysozyme M1 (1,4-beta-N-acetylmuramidase)